MSIYYIKQKDFQRALDLLKRSETLSENNEISKATVFNNMACYYRK